MSKDKPEQSAEEIVSLIISNTASQYSEEWKPDIVYTKEELIKIVESYKDLCVKKACKEQREICANKYASHQPESHEESAYNTIINAPSPDQ